MSLVVNVWPIKWSSFRLTNTIGISTNRFLAKTAASLHKPDGLDVITHENLERVYAGLSLIDLNGINTRNQARLKACGIYTPLEFLAAPEEVLHKQVFESINGYYWYQRLRGYEVDAVDYARKSYGQSYSLKQPTGDPRALGQILFKLCEKLGRRLRRAGYVARGVHVGCIYADWTHWHRGRGVDTPLLTTLEIYRKMWWVLDQQPEPKVIAKISVTCYDLEEAASAQASLFDLAPDKKRKVAAAIDRINDRYGEFTIRPALMLGIGEDIVMDRISFGQVKELEDLYGVS